MNKIYCRSLIEFIAVELPELPNCEQQLSCQSESDCICKERTIKAIALGIPFKEPDQVRYKLLLNPEEVEIGKLYDVPTGFTVEIKELCGHPNYNLTNKECGDSCDDCNKFPTTVAFLKALPKLAEEKKQADTLPSWYGKNVTKPFIDNSISLLKKYLQESTVEERHKIWQQISEDIYGTDLLMEWKKDTEYDTMKEESQEELWNDVDGMLFQRTRNDLPAIIEDLKSKFKLTRI